MMSISKQERETLHSIENDLISSGQKLASMLAMFTRLTAGVQMPVRERIQWPALSPPAGRARAAAGAQADQDVQAGARRMAEWLTVRAACRLLAVRPCGTIASGRVDAVPAAFAEMASARGRLSAWLHGVTGDPAQAGTVPLCAGDARWSFASRPATCPAAGRVSGNREDLEDDPEPDRGEGVADVLGDQCRARDGRAEAEDGEPGNDVAERAPRAAVWHASKFLPAISSSRIPPPGASHRRRETSHPPVALIQYRVTMYFT
jgi:hypothetical protein